MDNEHRRRRKYELLIVASLPETDPDCPPADKLAAYILGTLAGIEQLVVAAHVRQCPMCQYTVATIRPPEARRRTLVATLLPLPVAEGERRSGRHGYTRQYQADDLIVKLTVPPPSREYWRITGRALRADAGLADQRVTLRAGRRQYEQHSDAQGFFTFAGLPAGRYTLAIMDEQVTVQIRDVVLSLDDDVLNTG
jgi:anti-sigma factor RsiW